MPIHCVGSSSRVDLNRGVIAREYADHMRKFLRNNYSSLNDATIYFWATLQKNNNTQACISLFQANSMWYLGFSDPNFREHGAYRIHHNTFLYLTHLDILIRPYVYDYISKTDLANALQALYTAVTNDFKEGIL
jgi:hypothetical protein